MDVAVREVRGTSARQSARIAILCEIDVVDDSGRPSRVNYPSTLRLVLQLVPMLRRESRALRGEFTGAVVTIFPRRGV